MTHKSTLNHIIRAIAVVITMMVVHMVFAYGSLDGERCYEKDGRQWYFVALDDYSAIVTGVWPSYGSIEIPSSVYAVFHRPDDDSQYTVNYSVRGVAGDYRQALYGEICAWRDATSIRVPDGVERVWERTFSSEFARDVGKESKLEALYLPQSVTSIGAGACWGCHELKTVVLPVNLRVIEPETFEGCQSLTNISLSNGLTSLPNGLTDIGEEAFAWCQKLVVELPKRLKSIGSSAFASCASFDCGMIPDSVTNIGASAFSCCAITNLFLPAGLDRIEHGVFAGCEKLAKVRCPSEMISIGDAAFKGCKNLSQVQLPLKVKDIGNDAFYGCKKLTRVVFPASVKHIGQKAFADTGLKAVYFEGAPPSCEFYPFGGVKAEGFCDSMYVTEWSKVVDLNTGYWNGIHFAAFDPKCQGASILYNFKGIEDLGDFDPQKAYALLFEVSPDGRIGNREIARSLPDGRLYFTDGDGVYYIYYGYDGVEWTSAAQPGKVSVVGKEAKECTVYFRRTECQHEVEVHFDPGDGMMPPDASQMMTFSSMPQSLNLVTIYEEALPKPIEPTSMFASSTCYVFDGWYETYSGRGTPRRITGAHNIVFEGPLKTLRLDVKAQYKKITLWSWRDFYPIRHNWGSVSSYSYAGEETLTTAYVADGVTEIGEHAFEGCSSLGTVGISSSVVAIGDNAFSDCAALTDIYFEGNAPTCGADVFRSVPSTCVIWIMSGATGWDDDGDGRWQGLPLRTLPDNSDCPGEIEEDGPFEAEVAGRTYYCQRENHAVTICSCSFEEGESLALTIPSQFGCSPVISIGRYAFSGCQGLTSVDIPEGVQSIGVQAFSGCYDLTQITFPSTLRTIEPYAFGWCLGLEYVEIPVGVTTIGEGAFTTCGYLETVVLPEGLTTISSNVFNSCCLLRTVTIPSTVTKIEPTAFSACSNLGRVYVTPGDEERVSRLLSESGVDVSGIEFVGKTPEGLLINQGLLIGFEGMMQPGEAVVVPDCVTGMVDYVFAGMPMGSVVIPSSVKRISNYAFASCRQLNVVTLAPSIESIGDGAFSWCSELRSIVLPAALREVGHFAFEGCSALREIAVMGGNSRYYSEGGVLYDRQTESLVCCPGGFEGGLQVPEGVTEIGYAACELCTKLKSVKLPSSVTSLGFGAFFSCTNLATLAFDGNAPLVGERAFEGVPSNCTAIVRKGTSGWNVPIPGLWQGIQIVSAPDAGLYVLLLRGNSSVMMAMNCVQDQVYKLPNCTLTPPAGKRFAGWACSNGRRYDDGMLVFNLAQPGETVTMTAVWE